MPNKSNQPNPACPAVTEALCKHHHILDRSEISPHTFTLNSHPFLRVVIITKNYRNLPKSNPNPNPKSKC